MKSSWVEADARATVERYAAQGIGRDLALRVYTTRLLGRDPKLVLHGGGNTSVKTIMPDLLGEEVEALCIKGSGADMAAIEPHGMPALRLDRLRKLRARASLGDEDMLRIQRETLLDPSSPNPSVETLLHAFLPHKFVDHTHASAILSLSDQPDGAAICADLFDGQVGIVPYVMPGFGLAKRAAAVYDAAPAVEGLILDKHGLFTFGDDARESYERTIALVTRAEERLQTGRRAVFATAHMPQQVAPAVDVAPIVRGACALRDGKIEGAWRRSILEFRGERCDRQFRQRRGAAPLRPGRRRHARPRHPHQGLAADRAGAGGRQARGFSRAARQAAADYVAHYDDYFTRHNARVGGGKRAADPLPRIVLVPGLGLFGLGRSRKDARIAADVAESAIDVITDAEAIGRFQSITEADMFDMEYWPLERAKLGTASDLPLAGQIAVITGAGGAIGAATARAFAAAGAEVALLDVNLSAVIEQAKSIGGGAIPVKCDVTDAASVRDAFDAGGGDVRRRRHRGVERRAPPGRAASAKSTRPCCARASSSISTATSVSRRRR